MKTLEELKDAAERFANRLEYRRPAKTQEQSEHEVKYWDTVFAPKQQTPFVNARALTQEIGYAEARKAFVDILEARADEIATLTNNPNFTWAWEARQGEVIKSALQWFINDPKCSLQLTKGLFWYGMPGTGKTELMTAFQKLAVSLGLSKQFQYSNMSDIYTEAKTNKDYNPIGTNAQFARCLDEFGTNSGEVMIMGNPININHALLETRYRRFQTYGQLTHFISNADPNSLSSMFSPMLLDRIRSMCTGLYMPGNSKR